MLSPVLLAAKFHLMDTTRGGQHEGVANSLRSIHADYFFHAGRDSGNHLLRGTTAGTFSTVRHRRVTSASTKQAATNAILRLEQLQSKMEALLNGC
jgi:hypothetical protein